MKLQDLYIPAEQHVQNEKVRKHKPLCCFYCFFFVSEQLHIDEDIIW